MTTRLAAALTIVLTILAAALAIAAFLVAGEGPDHLLPASETLGVGAAALAAAWLTARD